MTNTYLIYIYLNVQYIHIYIYTHTLIYTCTCDIYITNTFIYYNSQKFRLCELVSIYRETNIMLLLLLPYVTNQDSWPTICNGVAISRNRSSFRRCDNHTHKDLECSERYQELVEGSWKICMTAAHGRDIQEFHTTVLNPLAPGPSQQGGGILSMKKKLGLLLPVSGLGLFLLER